MSFYTQFNTAEAIVTSSTTSLLLASDPVLIFSANQGHASQSSVGAVSAQYAVTTATSQSTGTNISNYGITYVTGPSTASAWLLSDPTVAGLCKTVFWTSSTSTASLVTGVSATLLATDTQSGTTFTFSKTGAYVELSAKSTSVWAVVGRSAAGVACT